jgi:hypothetical protein
MQAMFPRLIASWRTARRPSLVGLLLVLAASVASAATPPAGGKRAPNAVAPKSDQKTVAPVGNIDGVTIPRPNGTFLGLQIVNSNFVLSFYNAKKRKIAPDVTRATLRWPVKYQPADERAVLNPGSDGTSLTSPKTVRPPHQFRATLNLFVEGNDSAVETYAVDYTSAADAP